MRLADALRVSPNRVIAFTGAGGKTSAIARLTNELSEGLRVVVTTTTKLGLEQTSLCNKHLIIEHPQSLETLQSLLETERSVIVTGAVCDDEPKWSGLSPSELEKVHHVVLQSEAVLLIEADGARGRSLKAPSDQEPVIPPFTDLVVPIVGMDVVGEVLSGDHVHRPDRVRSLLGMAVGERVEPWHIVELLSHPEGGLKGVPPEAEVRIILNKTEAIDRLEQGRVIAESLLSSPEVQAIVLANVIRDPSVREVIGRVAGIVLAAGGSTRLKQLKQLVQWRSRSLVWHVVQAALGGGLSPIIVVVGAQAERVRQVLADQPVAIIDNPSWECGLSSSLRIGLKAVEERVEAVVVLLADMPFIREDLVKVLIQGHRLSQSPLIAPQAGGRRANPVLFDRATFPSLHGLSGDRGGRELFERFPSILVPWDESILFDVDTIEDLRQLEEME